jgi:hypothetical protein
MCWIKLDDKSYFWSLDMVCLEALLGRFICAHEYSYFCYELLALRSFLPITFFFQWWLPKLSSSWQMIFFFDHLYNDFFIVKNLSLPLQRLAPTGIRPAYWNITIIFSCYYIFSSVFNDNLWAKNRCQLLKCPFSSMYLTIIRIKTAD